MPTQTLNSIFMASLPPTSSGIPPPPPSNNTASKHGSSRSDQEVHYHHFISMASASAEACSALERRKVHIFRYALSSCWIDAPAPVLTPHCCSYHSVAVYRHRILHAVLSSLSDPQARPNPLLFKLSHLLSIIPVNFGFLLNIYRPSRPQDLTSQCPSPPHPPGSQDLSLSKLTSTPHRTCSTNSLLAALIFCMLAALSRLRITAGFLSRLRADYPPSSTFPDYKSHVCWRYM
jgi:hypothetical protein